MWDKILQFLNDNKDALGWLFGSGVVLAVLSGIYRFIVWLMKEYRLRQIRTNENFPFKIIPPNSNVAKEILGGADDDPLADRNIPYQQRIQGRNTRREFEELLEDNRWLIIVGRTGLGKTREAVQLAQSLNNEGWTILHLTRETWLDAPAKLPINVPERKLLFFLDDLNKKCLSSKAEIRPNARESLTLPVSEPFQLRLQRTLEAFDTYCGKGEIRVIATARNEKTSEFDEPSEWEKLGWTKHHGLWERFKLVDLSEPDKNAEQKLLAEAAKKVDIYVKPGELPVLAKRNDGTFRNLVENLASAKTEGYVLTSENFRDTLKGTWQKRYQKAVQKYPEAKYIYDAIELLQNIGIQINLSNILEAAEIVSGESLFRRIKSRWKYSSVLKQLAKNENLLHPKDGQIEAKGYKINYKDYLEKFLLLIWKRLLDEDFRFYPPTIRSLDIYLTHKTFYYVFRHLIKSVISFDQKITYKEHVLNFILQVCIAYNAIAVAYSQLGFQDQAEKIYSKTIIMEQKNPLRSLLHSGSNGITLKNLGETYYKMGRYEAAIAAFQNSIKADSKFPEPWKGLGRVYSSTKDYAQALTAYKNAVELSPSSVIYRAYLVATLRRLEQEDEAAEQEKAARLLMKKDNEYDRARFEAICGNTDESLRFLKIALEKKQRSIKWALQDPDFDLIRDELRFRELFEPF